jgi:hypothetical protein
MSKIVGFGAVSAEEAAAAGFEATLAGVPTSADLKADAEPYLRALSGIGSPKDPTTDSAIEWGMKALPKLGKEFGVQVPTNEKDLIMLAAGMGPSFLGSPGGGGIPLDKFPTNIKELETLLVHGAAAYACQQVGIPPELGSVTVEALLDGELTDKDFEAIGGVSGAMGGSAVCSMLGIPPQIGGWVGAQVGKFVGGAVASVLSIGGGKAERREAERRRRAQEAAVRGALESQRKQYQELCVNQIRPEYWHAFDSAIERLEMQWQGFECDAAVRFPLLWTHPSARGLYYFQHPLMSGCSPQTSPTLNRFGSCIDGRKYLPHTDPKGCSYIYGCPYPSFPSLGAGEFERDAQAIAAYDVWWMPPDTRSVNDQQWWNAFQAPSSKLVSEIARYQDIKSRCKSNTCKNINQKEVDKRVTAYGASLQGTLNAASDIGPLVSASLRVQNDIISTGATYKVAGVIRAQQQLLRSNAREALLRSISKNRADAELVVRNNELMRDAAVFGRRMNGFLNYGMLALGGGILGAAVVRSRR